MDHLIVLFFMNGIVAGTHLEDDSVWNSGAEIKINVFNFLSNYKKCNNFTDLKLPFPDDETKKYKKERTVN